MVTLCLELFGFSDHTPLAGRLGSIALIGGGLLTSGVVALRLGRCLARLRTRSHEHAHAARIVGRPTDHPPHVVVVEADLPAAYCVIGRPPRHRRHLGGRKIVGPSAIESGSGA